MKFTDGQWLLRPGVTAHYAAEAHTIAVEPDRLVISAPVRPIQHRGDTLQGPLLTVTVSSPLPDVARVRIEHFTGAAERGPNLPLVTNDSAPVAIQDSAEAVTLQSGALTVRVKKPGWELAFEADGRVLTRNGWRATGYVQLERDRTHVHEQLSLGVGECVYGLGERFTAFVKNGQVVECTNKDGGTASEQAYKNVPFYLTNRGYGVLVNETGPVSFEVASEKVARVQFSIPGESLEYFVIYGPTPKDILRKLTALTGRPALPPPWSFGLWLSTSFTTNYDEATVTSFIDGMKQRDLPLHVFHFDCFWMREFDWCNFEWDPRVFPDPRGMLQRLHARGLKLCVWINSYIGQRSRLFAEGREKGYFIKRTDGSVWQTDLWQPGMAIVDFTNPAARAWFAGHIERLLDMGVDAIKTDFGERIPTEGVVYHDGSDPVKMHNFYPVIYNETVFRAIEAKRGRGEAVLFARAAYASGQRFPVHWGGDCWSTMESMAESLRGGLSLGMCGFGFWSHDIGGFEGTAPAYIYKRWAAFGLLSSHSRLHGSSSYRVPWAYDDEACDVVRFFTKLKCRLMPCLWSAALTAHREGVPMMRAMLLEFPGDPACDTLDRQYMLGDALLVAPVFTEDGTVDYYLPEGKWTHLLTGETQEGGGWRRGRHGFLSLPLFVRPGTVLALGATDDRPDYDYAADTTFRVYELAEGAKSTAVICGADGTEQARVQVQRSGQRIRAKLTGEVRGAWNLQLAGVKTVRPGKGAAASADPLGVIIRVEPGINEVECECG
ncbi:alpha-xylosidase [Opitutus terrae]|uniref:alpha-D-xyloside xylohydrolase n=1 Tax=Opitutus terrae (strain DSM 11246 / JCM 15787 / PB90-1) TaxID=452637 RepID=B1ZVV0_OPITP|nr:alpha-xylosidase [Opitutus terrae]ACB75036.1 glycoside hydrolase family 31 [Opitutus terrae PB90-1]